MREENERERRDVKEGDKERNKERNNSNKRRDGGRRREMLG